jgi:MFS family permease
MHQTKRTVVATYNLVIRRLMMCSLAIVVSRAITSPLLALFLSSRLGLSQQDVGLLVGIAAFVGTLIGLYGGYVVVRFEKRKLLILAMSSSAIGFLLLTTAQQPFQATLCLVISESASALFVIGSKSMLGEHLPVSLRARAFSLRYTLTNIGYATGPMIGVVLSGLHSLAPFWTASSIALLSTLLMRGVPRDQRGDEPPLKLPPSFLEAARTLKRDQNLVFFTFGSLLNAVVYGRFTIYLSLYLLVVYPPDIAMQTLSAVLACNAITVIVLQYQLGRLLRREHLAYWMSSGSALFFIGLLGFTYSNNLISWCLAMFIFTLGEMIVLPGEFLFIDIIAPDHLRGSYYGAQNLAALGGAISPIICGYLLSHSATSSMFIVLMGIAGIGGVLCFMSIQRAHQTSYKAPK